MHEIYREQYGYGNSRFEIIIFEADKKYVIKSFLQRTLVDKFSKIISSEKITGSALADLPENKFSKLIEIAKNRIERNLSSTWQ